jgi:hypothetical protein
LFEKNNFIVWANDFSENSGEGRLARNFLFKIQEYYPNSIFKIKTFDQEFVFTKNKILTKKIINKNNFFYKYISLFYGIFYLWKYRSKKIVYLNYLPLWNFLIFLFLPSKTILGPVTGGVNAKKPDSLENIFRVIFFPIFYRISLFIISIRFNKIIFSTNLLKKYSYTNKANFFFGYVYSLFSKKIYISNPKKKFDLIFYNRNYKSKKNFLIKKIILHLPREIKVCVIGDKLVGENLFNYGYVSHKKILKLISKSKMAFGSSENALSLFVIDCYNSGIRLIFDRSTFLDDIICKKNITIVNYRNYIDSSLIITSALFNYKFKIDPAFNKLLRRKFFLLDKFLKNYFIS